MQQVFEKFLGKQINLSAAQISQGSKSHTYIRELLENKRRNDAAFPWLIEGDFLSGSYARGTKIHPLDDIDVMIVLDGTGLYAISNGVTLNAIVRGSGYEGSPVMHYTDQFGLISSKRVLEIFREAIKESYPDSKIKKDGQAVNVWLDSYQLGLDIVPCFHIIPRTGSRDFYYIPYGRESEMWIATNPKIDQEISETLDQRHSKKLKAIIKLIKYWNKTQNAERLRSYHIEAVAWYVFHNHPGRITNYADALRYFFSNAIAYLTNNCSDPTGIGGYIDLYLSPLARTQTVQKVIEVNKLLNNSPTFRSLTQPQLMEWQKIFGNQLN